MTFYIVLLQIHPSKWLQKLAFTRTDLDLVIAKPTRVQFFVPQCILYVRLRIGHVNVFVNRLDKIFPCYHENILANVICNLQLFFAKNIPYTALMIVDFENDDETSQSINLVIVVYSARYACRLWWATGSGHLPCWTLLRPFNI